MKPTLIAIAMITGTWGLTNAQTPGKTTRIFHDEYCSNALKDTIVMLCPADTLSKSKAIEIRAHTSDKDSKTAGTASYGIIWGISEDGSRYQATLSSDTEAHFGDYIDRPGVTLRIDRFNADGSSENLTTRRLTKNIDSDRCHNTLAAEIDCTSGDVEILAGNDMPEPVAHLQIPRDEACLGTGIVAIGSPTFDLIVSERITDPTTELMTEWTTESLSRYFAGTHDGTEGFWKYLDRDNDPRYCRPGGTYTLAFVADNNGGYDIIYIDGAETSASLWREGMIKGHLEPTRFKNHYNVRWIDASLNEICDESSATIEQGAIVRFDFPMLKTAIRFSK